MINKIIVKNESRDVFPEREILGISGENKFETLQFNLDNFIDGEALLRVERKEDNGTAKYEIAVEKGDNCYTVEVLSSLLAYKGTIKLQLVIMQENLEVFKSKYFNMKVLEAIEAGEEIPEQYPTWQQLASQKIIEIDSKLEEVTALEEDLDDKVQSGYFKGEKGDTGDPGQDGASGIDGFSPTVQTQTIETGVQVTITDVNGPHTFTVLNGQDGRIDEKAISQAVTEYLNEHSIVVPTKTSDLTNDSNFVADANYVHTENNYTTEEKRKLERLNNYDDTEVRQSITSLNNDKANRSELPDVSNFITKSVNNLTNYYLKNDTYTKQEVNTLIGQIATISIQVVQELPQNGQANIIYFVPKTGTTNDVYNEYIYINNTYELIGSTQVDLTGYATENWVNTQISNFLTQSQIETLINNSLVGYAKTQDIPTAISELTEDSTHRTVTDVEKTSWNNKSNFSGNYNDLTNKPTIPSEVTESTISNWGFTKNTGTYSKPQNGIPKTDLETAVQTSLGKADTALQSYTEQYTGTITGITMNGTTKGTSGVVDLGTVITGHQDISGKLDTSKVKNALSTTAGDVYDVRYINSVVGSIETLLQEV